MIPQFVHRFLASVSSAQPGLNSAELSKRHVGEMVWLAGGQVATLILGFVSIKLITSIGPDGYGRFVLATSVVSIMSLTFFGPLEQGYIRMYFVYKDEPDHRAVYLSSLLKVLQWSFGALIILGLLAAVVCLFSIGMEAGFYVASASMVIFAVLNVPINGMLNAMRMRKETAIVQVVERAIVIALLGAVMLSWMLDATVVMVCVAIASAVTLVIRLRIYRRVRDSVRVFGDLVRTDGHRAMEREIFRKIVSYSTPFLLWGVLSWIQLNGERWVINGMLNGSDVGRYGLAVNLINNSAVVVFNVLTLYAVPIIFGKFTTSDRSFSGMRLIRVYGWATVALFLSVGIVLLVGGDAIVHLISTRQFIIGGPILFFLTIGLGAFSVGQTLTQVGLAYHRPDIYIAPKVVTAVLSIAAYLAGCYWAGIAGVVGAIVIINLLYLLFIYAANKHLLATHPVVPIAAAVTE
jgi:O-antigen/teichoic acid export membrane protein